MKRFREAYVVLFIWSINGKYEGIDDVLTLLLFSLHAVINYRRFSSSDLSGDLDPDFASGVAGNVQQPIYGAHAEQFGVGPAPATHPPGAPSAPQTPLITAGQPSQQGKERG